MKANLGKFIWYKFQSNMTGSKLYTQVLFRLFVFKGKYFETKNILNSCHMPCNISSNKTPSFVKFSWKTTLITVHTCLSKSFWGLRIALDTRQKQPYLVLITTFKILPCKRKLTIALNSLCC